MKHKSKKSLGQNFILHSSTAKKVVDLSGNLEKYNVIEIGPGYGSLTQEILKRSPKFLLSIEKDSDLVKQHDQLLDNYQTQYKIIEADALYVVEEELVDYPIKIIASLPYNISVALLLKWLYKIGIFTRLTLIFQKEVADRIAAHHNSKDYGYLSILSQLLCDVKVEFTLSPEEFYPRPKVYSSVVTINPLPTRRFAVNLEVLAKLTRIVFAQRRKMLRVSLSMVDGIEDVFNKSQLLGSERPENLTIEQFCLLANNIRSSTSFTSF